MPAPRMSASSGGASRRITRTHPTGRPPPRPLARPCSVLPAPSDRRPRNGPSAVHSKRQSEPPGIHGIVHPLRAGRRCRTLTKIPPRGNVRKVMLRTHPGACREYSEASAHRSDNDDGTTGLWAPSEAGAAPSLRAVHTPDFPGLLRRLAAGNHQQCPSHLRPRVRGLEAGPTRRTVYRPRNWIAPSSGTIHLCTGYKNDEPETRRVMPIGAMPRGASSPRTGSSRRVCRM